MKEYFIKYMYNKKINKISYTNDELIDKGKTTPQQHLFN